MLTKLKVHMDKLDDIKMNKIGSKHILDFYMLIIASLPIYVCIYASMYACRYAYMSTKM